jgi:hypothetical protein
VAKKSVEQLLESAVKAATRERDELVATGQAGSRRRQLLSALLVNLDQVLAGLRS